MDCSNIIFVCFVYPGCWHFDNGSKSKIGDVLTDHGGLLHVLPLSVHLNFLSVGWVGGLCDFSVSSSPLRTKLGFELGWTGFGFSIGGLGSGLDN